jgi:predicted permease
MVETIIVIAPLFLIIFAAAILQKYKNVAENWSSVLNSFAFNIGLPALIFAALSKTRFDFTEQADLIIANSIFLIVGFVLAFVLGKTFGLKKRLFRTLFICFTFGNVAYLGIPTLIQISGESILPKASLIVAVYLFWFFTIGIGYLDYTQITRKKDIVKRIALHLIKNPLLIAVILGILVSSLEITIPSIVRQSIDMVSASVTPIVLVVIGLFIGQSRLGKLGEWIPVFLFSATTLMALPAIFYFGAILFGFEPVHFQASIIEAAMPLAITPFALADDFHLDKNFIARSIVLSTILAVVTIPFWISFV